MTSTIIEGTMLKLYIHRKILQLIKDIDEVKDKRHLMIHSPFSFKMHFFVLHSILTFRGKLS